MPVIKSITPTAAYSRILAKLGLELNSAARMPMQEIKRLVYALGEDLDTQFEFIEQQELYCEMSCDDIEFTTEALPDYETDKAASTPMTWGQEQGYCGRASAGDFMSAGTTNVSTVNQSSIPSMTFQKRPSNDIFPAQFRSTIEKLSEGSISTLHRENLVTENVFARLTDAEVDEFDFPAADHTAIKCIITQTRLQALKRIKMQQQALQMPHNVITDALPISSKITLKALRKHKMLNLSLYTTALVEDVNAIFARYPAIPREDRQNILAGICLARYAQKVACA